MACFAAGQGDVESVYQTAEDELGLRQKYSRTNSLASGSVLSAGRSCVLHIPAAPVSQLERCACCFMKRVGAQGE